MYPTKNMLIFSSDLLSIVKLQKVHDSFSFMFLSAVLMHRCVSFPFDLFSKEQVCREGHAQDISTAILYLVFILGLFF